MRSITATGFEPVNMKEIRLLQCLTPFRGAVNLGEPLVAAYFRELKRFKSFRDLPFNNFPTLAGRLSAAGLWYQLPVFPDTAMMHISPALTLQLGARWTEVSLQEQTQIEKAFVRYYRWMGGNLYDMYTYIAPNDRRSNLDFIGLEIHNLCYALHLALKHRLFDFTFILLPVNAYLDALNRHLQWHDLAMKVKSHLETIPRSQMNDDAWYSLVHMYDTLGAAQLRSEQYAAAETWYRKALETFRISGQDVLYPRAYRGLYQNLAAVTAYQQKWKESSRFYRQLRKVTEQFDDMEGLADFYLNSGVNSMQQQKYASAARYFKKAIPLFEELKLTQSVGLAHLHLGTVQVHLLRFDAAADNLERAESIYLSADDSFRQADVWDGRCLLFLKKREYALALSAAKRALALHTRNGQVRNAGISFQNMGVAAVGLQQTEEAADYLWQAYKIFDETGDQFRQQTLVEIIEKMKNFNGNLPAVDIINMHA